MVLKMLGSLNEDIQKNVASLLEDVFDARRDLSKILGRLEITGPLCSLLRRGNECVSMPSARALAALFLSIMSNKHMSFIAKDVIMPLINLAKSSNIYAAEMGITPLVNLLLDREIAEEDLADDIIPTLSRVLREGTIKGKQHAVATLARLVHHGPVDDVFIEGIHHCGIVLNLASLVCETNLEGKVTREALEALSLLAKENRGGALNHPLWTALAEIPCHLELLIICLATDIPPIQEKAIEVLSRLCQDQSVILGDMVIETPKCITVLGDRIIHSSSLEVKGGGTALLICVAKEHRQKTLEALNA